MQGDHGGIIQTLLELPIFQSEWVLWLLLGLSVLSVAVMVERLVFYLSRRVDVVALRRELERTLAAGDVAGAKRALGTDDSLEANVVRAGLEAIDRGAESAEDLMSAALGDERERFERRLQVLATLASNAPYIGLFGTVLGIVRSFKDMAANMADATAGVMAGIAEALLATAVGLLVAIPAVVAYNAFKGAAKKRLTAAEGLSLTVLAHLRSVEAPRARDAARSA